MSDVILGIDLGTTNSVVAVADGGSARVLTDADGQRLIPSAVSFRGSGEVLVGDVARERRLMAAEHTIYSVKRLIGRGFQSEEVTRAAERVAFKMVDNGRGGVSVIVHGDLYALVEISGYVLQECRRIAEQALRTTCKRAVLTVPANFNELQRSATKVAGEIAGLDVVRILNEPTAAAIAYGYGSSKTNERIVVYDMGGGTFDVTVLELDGDVFEVLSTAGDTFLGGDDVDLRIAEEMAYAFLKEHRWDPRTDPQAFERLRASAEWLKCSLSEKQTSQVTIPEFFHGAGGRPIDLNFRMTRAELEEHVMSLVNRSLGVCDEAMRMAGVKTEEVDTVILVGGSTRIPLLRDMVEEFFSTAARANIDPDTVVALGAAMQGYLLGGVQQNMPNLANLPIPTPEMVEQTRARKEAARQQHHNQPAFAPREAPVIEAPIARVGGPPPPPPPAVPGLPKSDKPPPPPPPLVAVEGAHTGSNQEAGQVYLPPSVPPAAVSLARVQLVKQRRPRTEPERIAPPPPAVPLDAAILDVLGERIDDGELIAVPDTAVQTSRSQVPMVARTAPVLMDVTPHSLGLEVAGGYSERIIGRGMPVPCQQRAVFSTARDGQEEVRVRVCQGESRTFEENAELGEAVLSGLPAAPRGKVNIEVLFVLDADGTLHVTATDVETKLEQSVRIRLLGGHSEDELESMRARQLAYHADTSEEHPS